MLCWTIAFLEYVLQVPANRIGRGHFSASHLKAIQEVITLSVFALFSMFQINEPIRWNHLVGFGFIVVGAWLVFAQFSPAQSSRA